MLLLVFGAANSAQDAVGGAYIGIFISLMGEDFHGQNLKLLRLYTSKLNVDEEMLCKCCLEYKR